MSQPYPTVGRSLVVLHVDDDPMNLRVVEEILTAFHHRSVKASSGAEALQHIAEQALRLQADPGLRPAGRHQGRRRAAVRAHGLALQD